MKSWFKLRPDPEERVGPARLAAVGVSFPIVAGLLGWNSSTTTKMAKCYGHIGNAVHRAAVATLDPQTKAKRGGIKVSTATAETKKGKAVSACVSFLSVR